MFFLINNCIYPFHQIRNEKCKGSQNSHTPAPKSKNILSYSYTDTCNLIRRKFPKISDKYAAGTADNTDDFTARTHRYSTFHSLMVRLSVSKFTPTFTTGR